MELDEATFDDIIDELSKRAEFTSGKFVLLFEEFDRVFFGGTTMADAKSLAIKYIIEEE